MRSTQLKRRHDCSSLARNALNCIAARKQEETSDTLMSGFGAPRVGDLQAHAGRASPANWNAAVGGEYFRERSTCSLLRNHILTRDQNLIVISEECDHWVESSHRIDLLCIDGEAKLVVVELCTE